MSILTRTTTRSNPPTTRRPFGEGILTAPTPFEPTASDRVWLALNPALPPALPGHTRVFYPSDGPLAWAPKAAGYEPFEVDRAWAAGQARVYPKGFVFDESEPAARIDRMLAIGACG